MPEEIAAGIYRIPVPLVGNPLKELNAYLLKGEDGNLLVDTGFRQPACRASAAPRWIIRRHPGLKPWGRGAPGAPWPSSAAVMARSPAGSRPVLRRTCPDMVSCWATSPNSRCSLPT